MTSTYIGHRPVPAIILGLVCALGLAAAGCSRSSDLPPLRAGTEEEATRLGQQLVAAAEAGDGEAIAALFDVGVLVGLGGGGSLDDEERRIVATSFRDSLKGSLGLGGKLIQTLEEGGTLRVFPTGGPVYDARPGEKWITLRVLPYVGGFDHVAMRVGARGQGEARFLDVAPLSVGEASSETLGRAINEITYARRKSTVLGLLTRGLARDNTVNEVFGAVNVMHKLMKEGDFVGALERFQALPDEVKRHRLVLLTRLRAASEIDDPAYLRALEDLKKHHPADPSWLMQSLDYYTLHELYDDAIASLTALRGRTIDDAYLHVMEANYHLLAKRYDDADAALARAREKEPDLQDIRWTAAEVTVQRGDFEKAGALYEAMIKDGLEVSLSGILETEGYEAFAASKPFKHLVQRYGDDEELEEHYDEDEGERAAREPPQVVGKAGVQREQGWLYYLDKDGNIARSRMVRGGEAKSPGDVPEIVVKTGVKREEGYLYYIDKNGDVARTRMSRGP